MPNDKDVLNNKELQKVVGGNYPKMIIGTVPLQIPGGGATSAPPISVALSNYGVNISKFVNEFNERTKQYEGYIVPTIIKIYADRSFSFVTKTPPHVSKLLDGKGHGKEPAPIGKDSFDFLK